MTIIDTRTGTNIEEIAQGLFRVSTPVPPDVIPGGFTFNQFLLVDEEPLLFHTGPRKFFPLTLAALRHVLPPEGLRWIAFSHFEADECGALNEWLAVRPTPSRFAANSRRWSPFRISPIVRPAVSPTAKQCVSADARCVGSTHPTFHTRWSAAISSMKPTAPYCVATCSASLATMFHP
jgi:hypothetical protein